MAKPTPAKALLTSFLNQFGLGALADWAWKVYTGAGDPELGMQLVQAQLPDQALFKQRFPAIGERIKKGLPAITPADYINYENTLRQAFVAHGLPFPVTGAPFNNMIAKLLVNDVSAAEVVNQRLGSAFARVANAPIEVREAARRVWGVNGDQALAAFFLDPTISAPELEKMSQTAEVMGTGNRFGIDLDIARSRRLAELGADQNLGKFADLAKLRQLFNENVGETVDLTLEGEGVGAAFGESDVAEQQVTRRLEERKAAFAGGGGPFESGSGTGGLAGLGSGPT